MLGHENYNYIRYSDVLLLGNKDLQYVAFLSSHNTGKFLTG